MESGRPGLEWIDAPRRPAGRGPLRTWTLAAIVCCSTTPGALAQREHPSRVRIAFDHLYTYEEMTDALHTLVAAYPELLSIQSIGKSVEGRELWAVTINNPTTGPDTAKPALYIDGNIHGNEVQAAEVPLYTIWYLTKSYGRVPALTELLDDYAFYLVPMVNPDGRAHWFDKPNTSSTSRSGTQPTDSDNDGLFDEDGYDDLDGDGEILEMRRRTPHGRWKDSPKDPRLMVRCEPGEPGQYERLGREGIDNDGDGLINEDGPGGYDMNRNWPADWQPNYVQFGAGDFPLCYPETRAVAEFILARPNIAGVQAYHNAGGMILRGPGVRYIPEYPRADLDVYDHMGREGEKALPFYRYMIVWKDLYVVHGGFVMWTYQHLGVFSFTNELWTGDQMFNRPSREGFVGREDDMLSFDDLLLFGQTFHKWKPFEHPVYGDIELGGWAKFSGRVPPGFLLAEVCHRNAAFTVLQAKFMPKLEIVDATVKPRGTDAFEITVEVKNLRIIPTVAAIAAQKKIGVRDSIEIEPKTGNVQVLAGGRLRDRFLGPLDFVKHRPQRVWNDEGIRGESSALFRWIVRGTGSVQVTYRSAKAKAVSRTVQVK